VQFVIQEHSTCEGWRVQARVAGASGRGGEKGEHPRTSTLTPQQLPSSNRSTDIQEHISQLPRFELELCRAYLGFRNVGGGCRSQAVKRLAESGGSTVTCKGLGCGVQGVGCGVYRLVPLYARAT
jgi:hypothetical protein